VVRGDLLGEDVEEGPPPPPPRKAIENVTRGEVEVRGGEAVKENRRTEREAAI